MHATNALFACNLKRAADHLGKIRSEIAYGTFDYAQVFPNSKRIAEHALLPGDAMSVKRYLTDWFARRRKAGLAASTTRDWNGIINNALIPQFGDLMLSRLTRRDVKFWLQGLDDDRPKPLSNKRLANIQSVLRAALDEAVEDEILEANVMGGYTYSRELPYDAETDKESADPLNSIEQAAILQACRTPAFRNYVQFAIWTGMRTSELIALDWADVDWIRGAVFVRRAMTRSAKGKAETTKTPAGRRAVKLLPLALAALNAQKAQTFLKGQEIFNNPGAGGRYEGRWTGDNQIWKVWQTTIKKAKVRYRNPYQTRHTYASMMLSAGEPPMWVARQMGHSDIVMIMRVYGRWMPDADLDAGSKAALKFGS